MAGKEGGTVKDETHFYWFLSIALKILSQIHMQANQLTPEIMFHNKKITIATAPIIFAVYPMNCSYAITVQKLSD